MDPERWRQISRIYYAAQARPSLERAAFLVQACDGDASLRRQVESLLAFEGAAANFLEHPPAGPTIATDGLAGDAVIAAGARFGDYEVVERIGAGGMGEVYRARDLTLHRTVALKFLAPDLTRDSGRVARFRQEARAASALNHPNVCTIHALGETADGQQFIAMEHIAGDTLRARLIGRHPPLREALDIAIQLGSGLSAAHAAGVVHRDLKPENVMLRPDGLVKVVDFGLAKLAPGSAGVDATRSGLHTDTGIVVGTVAYMSPEQARGQETDARTDIWSLGVMLYEMVTGRCPFAGQSSSDVLAAILDREPSPLAHVEPAAPSECERIVRKALRKDREQRYHVMKDLLLDLQALRDDSAIQRRGSAANEDPTPSDTIAVARASQRRLWPIGASAAVVLAAAGAWYIWSPRPPVSPPPSIVPLTSFPGDEYEPDLSWDGTQVAFGGTGEKRDNRDLYVMRIGDATALRLTTDPAHDGLPAWSPDGSQIAFVRGKEPSSAIYTISPFGGSERKLTDVPGYMGRMSWFPDSRGFVFDTLPPGSPRSEIVFFEITTGEKHTLVSVPASQARLRYPQISPKGDLLAYAYCENANRFSSCDPWVVGVGPDLRLKGQRSPELASGTCLSQDGHPLVTFRLRRVVVSQESL